MKMMDVSVQDDCNIEAVSSAKKKKMKQARLPFQMLSSVDSPNSVSNKKRKLTSPSVECKSPKVVKITTKENSIEEESKVNADKNNSLNESDGDIQVIEDVASDDVQETNMSNVLDVDDQKSTPRRNSTGKTRKLEKKSTTKPSALSKFLKKTDKEVEVKEDCQKSPKRERGTAKKSASSPTTKSARSTTSVMDNSEEKVEEVTTLAADDSLCVNSDSDIAILSSDSEDKDDQKGSNENVDKNTKGGSPVTPKASKSDKSVDPLKHRKLTPKQQEKKLESAKRREEREKLRLEKEKRLEEERENRRREKEERRKEKEEKEKADREQKLKEKKMKELKKQMEIEQKQKEKEAKEEERRKREEAKEEEKRKKEEERLEAERKKQKAASNFASFFVAKKQETKSIEEESVVEGKNFMPFEVKADMKVAPVTRRILTEEEKSLLEQKCNSGNAKKSNLYITEVKNKKIIPRKSGKTWPLETKDDVILLDEENDGSSNIVDQAVVAEKHRPKFLQFTENRRPPYWGTWRKQSGSINPRKPFSMDTKWFNYEIDSDEEWEEEEPGESLRGSDDEKDEENPDDNEYDVDNEFMVPHGYLSDEEAHADEEDQEDMSPETQKFKLKVLGEQFESERNTKTSKLKPKIIGYVWQEAENKFSENVPPRTVEFFSALQAWVRQIPVTLPTTSESESNSAIGDCGTPTQQQAPSSSKKTRVPQEALPHLIRLVHGNTHGRGFLVKEFMTYWNKRNKLGENQISKASLLQKIREIGRWVACPEEGPMHLKACWYVAEDIRKAHLPENEELTLPNRWSYTLTPKRKSDVLDIVEKPEKEEKEKEKEKKSVPLITQFTKKITQEEMKKQLSIKPAVNSSPKPQAQQKAPKRATLISVARGEQFSKTSREDLLKNFVTDDKTCKDSSVKEAEENSNDVIILKGPDEEPKGAKTAEEKKTDESSAKNERLEISSSMENGSHKNGRVGSPSAKKLKLGGKVRSKVSKNRVARSNKRKKSEVAPADVDEPGSKE